MKIKTASELLATRTLGSFHQSKLSSPQPVTVLPQKPQRQTAAQRRQALLANKTILAKNTSKAEKVEKAEKIEATTAKPVNASPQTEEQPTPSVPVVAPEPKAATAPPSPSSPKIDIAVVMTPLTPPESPSPVDATPAMEANARLLTAKKTGNLKTVLLEFASIKKQGLAINHHTYNLVLEAYSTLRREGSPLTCMLRVYEEMKQMNVSPSSFTYALLIRTLCRRDVEVQKTVAMLRRQSARTGHILKDIDVLELEGNLGKAMELFAKAMEAGHTQVFEVDLYNQLLRVLSHYGDTGNAVLVFGQLTASAHATANAATFAALINLFGRAGDIQAARRHFAMYQERKATMGAHDASYVYNALVDSHLKCGLLDGAIRVIEEDMVHDDIKLTIIPYNSIIRHYCTVLHLEKAHTVVNQLLQDPERLPQPDASTYGPILAAYCHVQDLNGARAVYADLVKLDIGKSYGNLANYALLCLSKDDGASALAVVEDMRRARLEPDPVLACRIIDFFSERQQVEKAMDAIYAILGVLSPRTLVKGQRQLLDATLRLINSLTHLAPMIQAVQVASPLWSGAKLPLPMALALVDHLLKHHKANSLDAMLNDEIDASLNKFTLLFDAVMMAQLPVDTTLSLCLALLQSMRSHDLVMPFYMVSRINGYWQKSGHVNAEAAWRSALDPATSSSNDDDKSLENAMQKDDDACQKGTNEQHMQKEAAEIDENDALTTVSRAAPAVASPAVPEDPVFAALVHTTLSQQMLDAAMQGEMQTALLHLSALVNSGDGDQLPLPEAARDAIAHVGKQGDIKVAVSMFEQCISAYEGYQAKHGQTKMSQHAVYDVTNSMLIGYAQMGDMQMAKVYYDRIKAMGLYPDGNGYASLLLGSAKCATDEASDALTIYDEAKRHHVKPTTFFYNVVISKLAKARKLEPALQLFDEMRHLHVGANAITYGAMISACVRAGAEGHARRLFSEMLASPTYQPRVGPFNNMMQFYVRQQPNRECVLEYFCEMRRRHIKPSPHTYKLLIEAYSTMVPYDMPTAHRMLSDMTRRDRIRPQATHYAALIYAYGTLQRDVQSADRVYDEMLKANVTPDEGVYQAMLDTLISNDKMDRAAEMYKAMVASIDKSSSPYIENLFIRGYGAMGRLDEAHAIFDAMVDDPSHREKKSAWKQNDDNAASTQSVAAWVQGIIVVREPSTYEAMVEAYKNQNDMDNANAVLQQMLDRDFPEKVVAVVAELVNAA
ncbi:hypothetical protein BC940DRAFT_319462 [Gongronella butleri]|nr:hypothetical protein BC940DRAFT_319462 [Gongronella butleri]